MDTDFRFLCKKSAFLNKNCTIYKKKKNINSDISLYLHISLATVRKNSPTYLTLSAQKKKKTDTYANSIDPDHNEPSHQDLQALPF